MARQGALPKRIKATLPVPRSGAPQTPREGEATPSYSGERMIAMLLHPGLTSGERAVAALLAYHDGVGGAWPGVKTIARSLGMSERTAKRHIAALVERGLVRRIRCGRRRLYELSYPKREHIPDIPNQGGIGAKTDTNQGGIGAKTDTNQGGIGAKTDTNQGGIGAKTDTSRVTKLTPAPLNTEENKNDQTNDSSYLEARARARGDPPLTGGPPRTVSVGRGRFREALRGMRRRSE